MMNLKAQRAAALKAAQDIINGAKASERDLTDDEQSAVEAKFAEIESLDKKIAAEAKSKDLFSRIESMTPAGEVEESGAQAKSIGEHFVKSLNGRSMKTPGTIGAPEFKAAADTQVTTAYSSLLTEYDRSIVLPNRPRPVIADLLGSGAISGQAITYPVWGALEGGSSTVAEGGAKPQMHVADPTFRTDALSEIAGWFKLTDDMAEDLAFVVSEINSTALYDLAMKEEAQLLSGNGTSPNLSGILSRSGVQTETQGVSPDTAADAIFRALTKVQTATGMTADGIVINPADYQALRLSKDSNGQYMGGGFFAGQYGNGTLTAQPDLWGLRTVVTAAIPAKTVLVGAFASAATVYRKGGVRVESTNSHADDFTNDKITVRVRERVALAVRYPSAFVNVTVL